MTSNSGLKGPLELRYDVMNLPLTMLSMTEPFALNRVRSALAPEVFLASDQFPHIQSNRFKLEVATDYFMSLIWPL